MSNWIYRVGLSQTEVNEESLKKLGFKYELAEVEAALRAHIDETLGKSYKFYTSMREDAPEFFSCSSLISYLYTFAGVWMPSLSIDKFFFAQKVNKDELRFGDLVFAFNAEETGSDHLRTVSVEYMPGQLTTETPINHMGMYLGEGKILQAAGLWYKGQVISEDLETSPSFKNIVGYGRVADIHEKRFVVEIPDDRPDLRNKEKLIAEINSVL